MNGLTIGLLLVVLATLAITAVGLAAVNHAQRRRGDPHHPTLWRRLFDRDRMPPR